MTELAIVCVDDEPFVLDSLKEQLTRSLGDMYRIEVAESGEEALELLEELTEEGYEIPMIVSDQIMPGMSGDELLGEVHKRYPRSLKVFLTGLAGIDAVGKAVNNANLYRYISKPWDDVDLAMTVREGIRSYLQDKKVRAQHTTLEQLYGLAKQEISERKRIQQELESAQAELERRVQERTAELVEANSALQASNAELDAFAHTVAHDLKGPLSVVFGFLDVAQYNLEENDLAQLAESLQFALQMSHKMSSIVDELLLLSSVRREDVSVHPIEMSILLMQVQSRLQIMLNDKHMNIQMPEQWPLVLGYGPWVEEVWVNYISNAIKYGGDNPQVELGAEELDNGMIRFWVKDNGQGIAPEAQKMLFNEFSRLHKRVDGHGLGLSIVQRIMTKLGGEVGLESVVGQGSVFSFTLPKYQSDAEEMIFS